MHKGTKVAHVTLGLQPGGLEKLICNLATSPAMQGIETVVCCLDEPGSLAREIQPSGVRVIVVKRKRGYDPGLIFRLYRFFRQERVAVVHTHSLDPLFYGGLAAWLAQVPIRIHTQHNTYLKTYGWKERFKFWVGARICTKIVAVSEKTQRGILDYRVPAQRRVTILNGIDDTNFSRPSANEPTHSAAFRRDPQEQILGTVARLAPEKGLNRLLQAFASVLAVYPKCRLLLIGDGPERAQLESLARELNIRAHVDFLGYRDRIEELLPLLDVFVLPSLTEGIPLALLEAMAARLPIVATNVGGVPEVIVHGESGILIPPDDPVALKEAILDVLAHPEKRATLASSAQRRVREKFSLHSMAQAYKQLYLEDRPESIWSRFIKRYLLRALPKRWMLWRGHANRPVVAVTLDDGPDPTYTPQILDILDAYKAKATFFLIGAKAAQEREIVARILKRGHEIGNHSFSHPHFERLSWKQALKEITEAQSVLEEIQGSACRLFRPPRGKLCLRSILGAWAKHLTVVMWSVDLKDFRAEDPEAIGARLNLEPISAGDIVLYHGQNPAALNALHKVMEAVTRRGLKVVPVSQLRAL